MSKAKFRQAVTSSTTWSSRQKMWASSVQLARLGAAKRQVAVAPPLQAEEVRVPGAVHRLEAELALLVGRDEDVLLVLAPVAAGLPQVGLVELRGVDLLIATLGLHAAVELDEQVVDRRALGQPEGRAG